MKRLPTVYHLALPLAVALLASSGVRMAYGQGTRCPYQGRSATAAELQRPEAPEKYPSGELSVYGLRKKMSAFMDKDVQVRGLSAANL